MGSAFQHLIYWSHSRICPERYKKSFNDPIRGFGVNAFPSKKRSSSSLKGAKSESSFTTAKGFFFTPRPGVRSKKYPRWRCCDADATETSASTVSFDILGSGPTTDNSPALCIPVEISHRLAESGLQVVKPVDEGVIRPIESLQIQAQEDRAIISSPPEPAIEAPLGHLELGTLSVREAIHPERVDVLQRSKNVAVLEGGRPVESATDDGTLQLPNTDEQPDKNLLQQIRDIVMFAGPALGIWLSGPMMSLIDTAVVGNSSSLELAALGPGTVFCDQTCYVFMFLSVATSNLIATSLAKQDEMEAAHHLSRLLFVALTCGIGMFVLTGAFSARLLEAFVGPQNVGLVPAAHSYVQIRGLAWPAVLVGMVAQSASLGMQDSWGPLRVLAVASFVNFMGDIILCSCLGYGIAGAAWATMASQYIGGYLMLRALSRKGYNALALSIPSYTELVHMIELAGPVLLTMLSKVSFYACITFLSTSLGAVTLAAHQVMIGIYSTCTVSGEPLAQTAQSFMPALIQGRNRNLRKAQALLQSLLLIGALCGAFLGCFAICFPWIFPGVFTQDKAVIQQMRAVTLPFLCGLVITPPLLSLEGTLLAGRDLKFLSLSMVSCFVGGTALLMVLKGLGFGLQGFWWTLACFQSTRFLMAFARLKSAKSVLRDSQSVSEESFARAKFS